MASGAQTATPATGATTNTASGLPTAGQVASTAPAPLQAFGGLPTVSPTYADPNQNQAYMQQYEGLEGAALAPQFQQQDQAEADQLASRGLTMSGAGAQLTNDLFGQQASALAGADAPIVSQGYGYTQQDIQGNQAAANQATATNAGYYNEALTGNASAYNNYLSQLYGTGAQTGNSELSAYLGSYGPNTGVESIMGTGLSGTQNAYTNIYDTMNQGQGTALGGLGSGLGTYYGDVAIAGAGG
jgi:hypothetical protein